MEFFPTEEVRTTLEAWRKESPLIRSIVEAIQDPFFILGQGGTVLLSNARGMALVGYGWDEFKQGAFSHLVAPKDQGRINRELETMDEDRELHFRIHLVDRSGGEIPTEFIGVIQGEVCFATVRDLRGQIKGEEEWERTKKEFVEKARERDQYSRELQVMRDLYKEKLREIKEMKDTIELLSYTDELTGICNRRFFIQLLTLEVERQKRYPYPLSLLMIDIDDFKHYNDTNGHLAGDQVLKAIARLIEKAVRQTDIVARFGGEEFTAILINAGKEEGLDIAERVRRNVAETHFPNERAQPKGKLTVSIGVAMFEPFMATPDAFLHEADKALYRAKRAGRNRVEA
jgi:diguanylate cyclase (GGDEF)-like protein